MFAIRPDVVVQPALEWWEVMFLTAGGAAAVLLLQAWIAAVPEVWADLVGWWRRRRGERPAGALPEHTAEEAEPEPPIQPSVPRTGADDDDLLRRIGQRFMPEMRIGGFVPTPPGPRWATTKAGLHLVDCKSGVKTEPRPEILSREHAAAYAHEHALRPCHVCKPLADQHTDQLEQVSGP
jgi:hypothetical protein